MVEQHIYLIVNHFSVSLIVKSVARLGLHVSETEEDANAIQKENLCFKNGGLGFSSLVACLSRMHSDLDSVLNTE